MKQNYYKDDCQEKKSFTPSILSPTILKDIDNFEKTRLEDTLKPKFNFSDCKTWNVYKLSDICSCNMGKHNKGNYADVLSYKCECEYVIKLDRNGYNCNEVNHHIRMAELGVAPPLYEVWRCMNDTHETKATILIMKKLDKTLLEWLESIDVVNQEELIFSVFSKLEEKVRVMHENDIIHYDLKVDNIMIDNDEPYIIDFGLSKSKEQHLDKTKINKLEYQILAYEIINGKPVFQNILKLKKLQHFKLKMFSYLPDTDRLTEMLEKQSPRQSPKFPKKSTPRQSPLRKSPLRKSLPKQSPVKEDPDKQLKDFIQKLFDKYDITAKDEMGAHREKIIETIIKKHKIDVNKAAKLVDDMTVDLF